MWIFNIWCAYLVECQGKYYYCVLILQYLLYFCVKYCALIYERPSPCCLRGTIAVICLQLFAIIYKPLWQPPTGLNLSQVILIDYLISRVTIRLCISSTCQSWLCLNGIMKSKWLYFIFLINTCVVLFYVNFWLTILCEWCLDIILCE